MKSHLDLAVINHHECYHRFHCILECFTFYMDKMDLREQVDMCKCAHVSMLEGGAKEGSMHLCCLEISILHTHILLCARLHFLPTPF